MKNRNRKFYRERLKELRKAVEISQRDLATILGVSEALPGLWESGNKSGPCEDNEEKLVSLFGVSPDFFCSDEYNGMMIMKEAAE